MTLNFNGAALALGKENLSPQTKFLHFFPQKDVKVHHAIPLFENFCFALALFRSKEIDNVELGLDLLDRCLQFQTEAGSFPRFLHEYPLDHSYLNSIDILNVLFWIGKEFFKVMPASLKEKLDKSIGRLINFAESKKSYFPGSSLFRFLVLKSTIENSPFCWEENFSSEFFCSKEGLKDLFLALQVFDLENKEDLSKKIWERSLNYYNMDLYSYIGPSDHIFQNEYDADLHLSDLFFLAIIKADRKIDLSDPVFLSASLIRPILNVSLPICEHEPSQDTSFFELIKDEKKWIGIKDKFYSFTSLENSPPVDKKFFGFHLFKAIFGDGLKINSLVCQHFTGEYFCKVNEKKAAELEFVLQEDIQEDEFELKFFLENSDCEILVNNRKATFFGFNDQIIIKNKSAAAKLSFELVDQGAKFCGHILRGNRPSQLSCRKDKFMAYDYMIALRTIARKPNCRIKAKLEFCPAL